ncbi:MAG: SH3 domain protein [Gammaproteobacteria bacterium]|jgi:SH3 domain protein
MRVFRPVSIVILGFLIQPLALAETRYVTDVFEVMLRSGTSTANSIIRVLKSGEAIVIIDSNLGGDYSFVKTTDDKSGYVLNRYLIDQPVARERLSALQNRHDLQNTEFNTLKQSFAAVEKGLQQLEADNMALKTALGASEDELTRVRNAAERTLLIIEENKQLDAIVKNLRGDKNQLEEENLELKDQKYMDYFVRGAAVSFIAFLIGIAITRIRWKKQSSWGSF